MITKDKKTTSQLMAISLLLLVGCSVFKNTGVAESDISGCWVRTVFIQQETGSVYEKKTYKLELGGSYTGERWSSITSSFTGTSSSGSHTLSGKWIIDDGYVVIQEGDGDKLTLKVISKHELIQVGSEYPVRVDVPITRPHLSFRTVRATFTAHGSLHSWAIG